VILDDLLARWATRPGRRAARAGEPARSSST